VRTGPTTQAELERLLADSIDEGAAPEVSGVRLRQVHRFGIWSRLLAVFGLASDSARAR